jgi:hypothetical protein
MTRSVDRLVSDGIIEAIPLEIEAGKQAKRIVRGVKRCEASFQDHQDHPDGSSGHQDSG